MEKALRHVGAISSVARREILDGIDGWLRSLALLDRGPRVRRVVDLGLTGIDVEPIPASLDQGQRAILVSNYPSVSSTLRAVMKIACRLPGERLRLKGIARRSILTEATPVLTALGIERVVFPVQKNEAGVYRLEKEVFKAVLTYLDGPGHVLWLSMTGRTRGNGLLEEDRRTGVAQFSVKKGVPIVPMGLVTREQKGRPRVVKIRFGEPINPPDVRQLADFEKADFLMDLSTLAMCQIAKLLPPGQRGDFDNADEKLAEANRRLRAYQL